MTTGPPSVPSFEEFERLVDAHVTPHMATLGYARIGAYSDESTAAYLVAEQPRLVRWIRHQLDRAFPRSGPVEYSMGYEALTDEAARRVLADDRVTDDEAWLSLDPSTGHLEFLLRETLSQMAERYGTESERDLIDSDDQPLPDRLSILDRLMARFIAATP